MNIQQTKTSRFMGGEEYRALPLLNYSACSDFDESRTKFYRKYVTGELKDEEKSDALVFGDLVHTLLLSPDSFDERFAMVGAELVPKPQMKLFADNLWELTKQCMTEKREVTRSISSLIEEAFEMTAHNSDGERVCFKGKKVDYVIERFESEIHPYYNSLKSNFGKDVISTRTHEKAERVASELCANPVTAKIVTMKNSKTHKVYHELPIFYKYGGHDMKSMIDILIVNHADKTIEFYDLKTHGWSFEHNILKHRYYLQWSLYYQGVKSWAETEGMGDYAIVPMQFITVSPDLSESPLIYTTSQKDLKCGVEGFVHHGRRYKGLDKILMEIAWHHSYNIWFMSYDDYQNNGVKRVSLFDEI